MLIGVSLLTSRGNSNAQFFSANKGSAWYLVSFGMIGASLSGVTFLSVPGKVDASQFSYFQMAMGYTVGYFFVAYVLLPVYYRHNVVSIYSYLEDRLGGLAHKIGAFYFLLARSVGAALRLFLVATTLDFILFSHYNIPFYVTVVVTILLIWVYTFKGGIATVVWTDSLQTLFMLVALGASIWYISDDLNWTVGEMITEVSMSKYSTIFTFDKLQGNFFIQFMNGALITMAMTGVDQDMMQKNLTCKSIGEAQKNMMTFSFVLVFINLAFLFLGALLFLYFEEKGIAITMSADKVFAEFALHQSGGSIFIGVMFLLGVIAAAYSSADSALTSLTTSFMVDFMPSDKQTTKNRILIHVFFSIVLFGIVMLVKAYADQGVSLIDHLFMAAGFTYGPLLGMFVFAIYTKRSVEQNWVPVICLLSPLICFVLKTYSTTYLAGYQLGHELLLVNTVITIGGLFLISKKD